MENIERLAFHVAWDAWGSSEAKELMMIYYPRDSTIELRDSQRNNIHLRRVPVSRDISKSLYAGGQLVVFSRHLRILDAANEQTAAYLRVSMEPVLCLFKAEETKKYPDALQSLLDSGLILTCCKLLALDRAVGDHIRTISAQLELEGNKSVLSESMVAYFLLRGTNPTQKYATLCLSHVRFFCPGVRCFSSPCRIKSICRTSRVRACECNGILWNAGEPLCTQSLSAGRKRPSICIHREFRALVCCGGPGFEIDRKL